MNDQTETTTKQGQGAGDGESASTIHAAAASAVSAEGVIPQVGDETPSGVIQGVRRYAEGGCDITFNGSDWVSAS